MGLGLNQVLKLNHGVLWSVEAKDRFGVVGRFGLVGCGFEGVLCCCETLDQWWWWLRRIGSGWWVMDLWVLWSPDQWLYWLCCCDGPHNEASVVKPRLVLTAKPQVVDVVKPQVVDLWVLWSLDRSPQRSHISTSPLFCYLENFNRYLGNRWFWICSHSFWSRFV